MVTFVFYVVIQVLSSLNFIYVHFWSPSGSGISGWHCCSVRFNCFDANSPICLMQAFLTEQCVYTQTYRHDDITHHTIDHGGITLTEKDASAVTKNERRRRSSRIRSCSKNGQTKGFIWSSLSHTKASFSLLSWSVAKSPQEPTPWAQCDSGEEHMLTWPEHKHILAIRTGI